MSILIKATAKNEAGNEITNEVTYDFGENIEEAIKKFGEEVVFSGFKRSAVITAQSIMRASIKAGKTADEVAAKIAEWVPGVAIARDSNPIAAAAAAFGKMTLEEQQAFLANLQAQMGN